MRTQPLRALAAACLIVSVTTAPIVAVAQTRKATPARAAPKPKPPTPPAYEPQERLKTSSEVKEESIAGAASTPLRDIGVEKTKVPAVLLEALTDPYAKPPKGYACNYLVALIKPLDEALGPDIDLNPVGDEDLVTRGKAMGVAADVASSALIPFRGVVRQISGAASHDRFVQSAYVAGSVRRAYLKGLGEARGCMPPATPSHERAGSVPASDKREMPKPKYPTRTSAAEPQTSPGTPAPSPR